MAQVPTLIPRLEFEALGIMTSKLNTTNLTKVMQLKVHEELCNYTWASSYAA